MMNRRIGFTLVEVMVGVVIGSVVLGVAFGIWSNSVRQVTRYSLRQRLQQEADTIMSRLSADIVAAKADTFEILSEKPLKLEFMRYAELEEGEKGFSKDKLEKVSYSLSGKMLSRTSTGGKRVLSLNVESIVLNRETSKSKETAYREARVDAELELKAASEGSKLEEVLLRRASFVIRDDFYNKLAMDRVDIFDVPAEELANMVVDDSKSSYINDGELSADALRNLSEDKLNDLHKEQAEIIKDTNEKIVKVNEQIGEVDSSTRLWGLWGSSDAKALDNTIKAVKNLKCSDDLDKLPEVNSGERASEIAGKYVDQLEGEISKSQDEFASKAFGSDGEGLSARLASEDTAEKEKAEFLKRVLEMKTTDRSLQKHVDDFNKDENKKKEQAEKDGKEYTPPPPEETIRLAIDVFKDDNSNAEIEKEVKMQYPDASAAELNTYIAERKKERDDFVKFYESCNLDWMDQKEYKDKVKDYNARVQLKNLAENKRDLFIIKEMAMDNTKLIKEALEGKNDLSSDEKG
jgi:prepilin-type N-terminal cleavage/methylation domain-containing protein